VIQDVANALKAMISTAHRETFDEYYKHKYSYTMSVVRATLMRNLIDAINKLKDEQTDDLFNTADEKRAAIDATFKAKGGYNNALKDAAEIGVKATFMKPDIVHGEWSKVFKGKFIIDRKDVVGRGGNVVNIDLSEGVLMMSKRSKKNNKTVQYNLVNAATRNLFGMARSRAWNVIEVYFAQAKSGAGLRTKAKEPRHLKGHGKAKALGQELKPAGKEQTTVAVLSLAADWNKLEKWASKKKYIDADVAKNVSVAQEAILNYLEYEYKIDRFRDVDLNEFREDLVIDIHATDPKGNTGMKKYDKHGIKENMQKFVDKKLMPQLLSGIKKDSKKWVEMKGSTSKKDLIVKQHQKMLIEKLLKVSGTRPDFRLKVNKRLLKQAKDAKGKSTAKPFSINTNKRKAGATKVGRAGPVGAVKKTKSPQQRAQGKTMDSPIALRNLLNEMLPQMVASKMTPPALQFRTGRFANSARVENVNIGPRGGIGIDYTYMRNPYETFEPGNKQGSVQRDPRKIIGASIRELAMGILGRQPTSLRRN